MISRYKKISIIYGRSGRDVAVKITNRLNSLHNENFYPVSAAIVAKKVMSGTSIFQQIKDAIAHSDICIIILTYDDVNGTRVRQNILIEIGMALMTVESTDRCIFLTEKELPEDFPSDLKGWINANLYDKDEPDEIVENIAEEVIGLLSLKSCKNILETDAYIYDYENILKDIPEHVFEKKADIQLNSILDCWQEGVGSFSFASERIMYLLERLKFFPDFNNNEKFFAFLDGVKNLIKFSEADLVYSNQKYLTQVSNFAATLVNYTELKLRKEVIKCMKNPSADPLAAAEYAAEFKAIADELETFIAKFEAGTFKYNWLIRVMAYEYAGLALMKAIGFKNEYDESVTEIVKRVILYYQKMLDVADDYGGSSTILWRGYAEYDLTRAYEAMYKITNDKSLLEEIRKYSHKSIVTRKNWCKVNSFRGVFTNALSFEYFLVKKHELELCYAYKEYAALTNEQLALEAEKLNRELKNYYDSSELGRLYDMKSSIDEFQTKVLNGRQ